MWHEITLIILFIIFVNLIIFYCIKRGLAKRINSRIDVDKNDLSGEINTVINSYFSLREMDSRNSEQTAKDLGDVQHFMDDENDEKNEPKNENEQNEPGSHLVMSNNISNIPK